MKKASNQYIARLPALLLALVLCATVTADAPEGWREERFEGSTRYSLSDQGCWRAHAEASASGLVREETVDLTATPVLRWGWRAERQPDWPDRGERGKEGDDFLARVYVIKKGWAPWRARAINYVWSRQHEPGDHWPNPYADQAHMVVVQGPADDGGWHRFERNVVEDFRRYHDMEVDEVDAVALMTDTDNTGVTATACYELPAFQAAGD